MLTPVLMAAGAAGVVVGWRLVVAGRVSLWVAMGAVLGAAGLASWAAGGVSLSPRVSAGWAVGAGVGAGLVLYLATVGFVLAVRRWEAFDRHVTEIYGRRGGLSLPLALVLAAAVLGPGEELFWRGLFQTRLAEAAGWPVGSALAWAAYVGANAASASLPILAAAVVSGAVWGALALWTHGVLASVCCHAVWTVLMVAVPPTGPLRRPGPAGASRAPA